jgi:hypothetical protein
MVVSSSGKVRNLGKGKATEYGREYRRNTHGQLKTGAVNWQLNGENIAAFVEKISNFLPRLDFRIRGA